MVMHTIKTLLLIKDILKTLLSHSIKKNNSAVTRLKWKKIK